MGPASEKLEIIIVGAGLGGLAASIECALSGHHVTVLETAPELAEIGAGLQITPNSSRLLKSWGVYDKLADMAVEPKKLCVHRYSGEVLSKEDDFDLQMNRKYGAPFVDMHRGDVQKALAARAKELGVVLKLGKRVDALDLDSTRAKVTTQDGKEHHCDLVVAADGLWSKCRECFLGRKDPPLATGDLAYRIVLRLDQIEDQDLRDWITNPTVNFWIGENSHVVSYSMKRGQMYNIVLLVPDDLPESVAKQAGSTEEMKRLFKGWDPILTRFLDCVDKVDKWKLMHREEMESWISPKGNLVFIGDACHPMLPYLAQGANSALEDGAVLGKILKGVDSRSSVYQALVVFEKLRKSRGEAIVRETFKQASRIPLASWTKLTELQRRDFHMPDGPEQQARDELFLSKLGKQIDCAFPSRWQCPQVQPWLYGYDAGKEVESVMQTCGVVQEAHQNGGLNMQDTGL